MKKTLLLLFTLAFALQSNTMSAQAFITEWVVSGTNILIPTNGGGGYNYNITWTNLTNAGVGDGSTTGETGNRLITGLQNGDRYQVEITGDFPHFYMANNATHKDKLHEITQWGNIAWANFEDAFNGCSNLSISATDVPNLAGVTNMMRMLSNCTSLNGPANINTWNTSNVTNMQALFRASVAFNQDIGNWNTANVTNMSFMFTSATVFNQDIGNWNTGNVTTMTEMFFGAANFNQDIGNWNTANVTNTGGMFRNAAAFNQDIGNWNMENIVGMTNMFNGATAFNQNLGNWQLRTAGVNMNNIFDNSGMDCVNYSSTLYGFAANPNTPNSITIGATAKTYSSSAATFRAILAAKSWTITDGGVNGACATQLSPNKYTFTTEWNTNATTEIVVPTTTGTYNYNVYWEQISTPSNNGLLSAQTADAIISGLTIGTDYRVEISGSFPHFFMNDNATHATKLQNITQWGDIVWTSMENAFHGCSNLQISATDIPNLLGITSMNNMFRKCTILNSPSNINSWNTASVTNMGQMFYQATAFNQNIGAWNTSSVTSMVQMFYQASAFNQNIGAWNTANVTNMQGMLRETPFNQNISSWNTDNVTTMQGMFFGTTAFNQDISSWNTANVVNMQGMFATASAFNQDISAWNTANVTNMTTVFNGATAFNQSLAAWTLNAAVDMANMLNNCGMSIANYDATLVGWNASGPNNRTLGATGLLYCSAASDRANLTTTKGWTISGDNLTGNTPTLITSGNSASLTASCANAFLNPSNAAQKMLSLNPNGNSITPSSVVVNNNNIGALPSGVSSTNGYYQINDGTNTMRIYNQLVSITAPGSFTANGGVIVRVYYDANVTADMITDATPVGSIVKTGWFKSSLGNAAAVIANMQPSFPSLSTAIELTPSSSGTEGGIDYVEFTLSSFSTIGFFAKTDISLLPVNLLQFNLHYDNCLANLYWQTANEYNFSHFDVQHSTNAVDFVSVGNIASAAQAGATSYSFAHNPNAPVAYYRLKMVDLDGSFSFSPLLAFNSANCNSTVFAPVFNPNPVVDYLLVQTPEQATVRIYHTDGKLLLTYANYLPNTPIDLRNFAAGVYVVEAVSPQGSVYRQKVQKL